MREAVREGERIGNRRNKWHLVARDTGIGPVETDCGRLIDRPVAFEAAGWEIDRERDSIKCRRCWGKASGVAPGPWEFCTVCGGGYLRTYKEHEGEQKHRVAVAVGRGTS